MGILSRLERRSHPGNPDRWLIRGLGGERASAGIDVDEDSAISLSTVFAAVRIISETLATVPVKLYRRLERGKEPATGNVIYTLIHDEPNEEQTPIEFYEMVQGFVELTGVGYAEIVRDGTGKGREMWPIPTHRVKPRRAANNALVYDVTDSVDGQPFTRTIPFEDMLTVRGFSRDGVCGLHVVSTMKESLGIALALDRFAGSYFGNGAEPGGFLYTEKAYKEEARKRLKDSWEAAHGGPFRKHRFALLDDGLKWQQSTIDPQKSQAIESRKFQVTEVARIFNIPPHLLKDLERATFSNIEQQAIEFVTFCMRPRLRRFAQALEKKLILPSQRSSLFIEHVIEELLVGDIKTRFEAYAMARQNGWMNANEIREKENQNPYEGGDEYLVQVNMVPARLLSSLYEQPQGDLSDPSEGSDATGRALLRIVQQRQQKAYSRLFREAASRSVRAEVGAIRKALRKSNAGADQTTFRTLLDTAYEEHMMFLRRAFQPVMMTFAEVSASTVYSDRSVDPVALQTFVVQYVDDFSKREAERSLTEIRELLTEDDPGQVIEARLEEWETSRAAEIAEREVRELADAVEQFITSPRRLAA